jgi:16S rRNA G966 N2-methylase RsmD
MNVIYNNNKNNYIKLNYNIFGGTADITIYDKPYTNDSLNGEFNGYPLSKYYSPSPSDMMKLLKDELFTNHTNIQKDKREDNKFNLIRSFPNDHILMDSISNHFTEKVRTTCRFQSYKTPKETWDIIVKNIVHKMLLDNKKLKYREVFELIYNTETCRICNTFNEAYCKWIITSISKIIKKPLNEINILDPSAGWGDRMIASIASGVKSYTGYDPNKKLEKSYHNIIDYFKKDYNTKININILPFEEADEKAESFDIVITSPPYYTVEIYDEDKELSKEQSVVKYPSYNDWVDNMYRPYLKKAYSYLKKGGVIVIYIEDVIVDGKYYPLSELTNNIIIGLGGKRDMSYGLNVIYNDNHHNIQTGGKYDKYNKYKKRDCNKRCAKSWIKK